MKRHDRLTPDANRPHSQKGWYSTANSRSFGFSVLDFSTNLLLGRCITEFFIRVRSKDCSLVRSSRVDLRGDSYIL